MEIFQPDYTYLQQAARNKEAARLPLYEHLVDVSVIEAMTGQELAGLLAGDKSDLAAFFERYACFFRDMGYDTLPYEECVGGVMPGAGALGNSSITPAISDRGDFERYPWAELPALYAKQAYPRFEALAGALPNGMQAVGGVGNGVFECVQDLVGFENLCYLSVDDPDLYADLFAKMGEVLDTIWAQFLHRFGDAYCVMRFGDDLGYKSNTMISSADIRRHILPVYRKIVSRVHACGKPFLLHSCGKIFDVMEDLIGVVGIDAKHSNEDQIAPFPEWVERYGERIGNFGGIDTDALCRLTRPEMREYITDVVRACTGKGGFAFGSGNSVPNYVSPGQYQMMNEIIREIREKPTY